MGKQARRRLGSVVFICLMPGTWMSEDGKLAIIHMMQGTEHEQWELYVTQLGEGKVDDFPNDSNDTDFLCGDFVCGSVDFAGRALVEDVERLAKEMA